VGLVVVAVAWTLAFVGLSLAEGLLAWDVRFAYLPAAEAVLAGENPYPALDDPILDEQKGYVYPPQLLFALMPLTPLPVPVAAALVAAGMIALLLATLRVLGVRDIRCYAAALLWVPAISGVLLSNISIPLAFALAVLWRYRDAVWPPAIALGLSVSAKLLLWPMLVWTLATRRVRATLAAALIGVSVTLAAWAAIGFDGLRMYPDLLERLSELQSERSYSFVGMAKTLGLAPSVGSAVCLLVGACLLVLCVAFARRDDDVRSFTCAVPLAIARPRFSAVWLLPVILWVSPKPGYAEGWATFAPAVAAAVLLVVLLYPRRRREPEIVEAPA
jgi:hypothetical protein